MSHLSTSNSCGGHFRCRFYAAYLQFFTEELLTKGAAATLEEYIFSPKANVEPPEHGKEPMHMVNRLLSGVLHPLIHTGYGAEFGLLGMFAEGKPVYPRLQCCVITRSPQGWPRLPYTMSPPRR